MSETTPERYFLLYAFPCAEGRCMRGEITCEEYRALHHLTINSEKAPNREFLKRAFPDAYEGIKDLAKGDEPWNIELIKHYFWNHHDPHPDKPTLNDFCKVHKAQVVGTANNTYTIKYDNRTRIVLSDLVPNASKGDYVMVHQGFAIEKVDIIK